MSGPALLLAGFAISGSPGEASSLLAGITIAAAVGGPVLGALLDRTGKPGRLLAATILLYAIGLAAILVGLGRLPLVVIVLIALLTGLLGPALSGGWTAQAARVVPAAKLSRASALDAMTFSMAGLAGPALAGGVAELFGASTAVVASVALIGLAMPAAWGLPVRPRPTRVSATSLIGDLVAGTRFIARTRPLARATLTSAISCMGEGMLIACSPVLGAHILGEASRGALLLSCVAVSSFAANAVVARFRPQIAPDTVIWITALIQAAALALAATPHPAVVLVAALIAGPGEGLQLTALFTVRHRESPEYLRGQIFTTGASLKITGFALGAAVAGPLAAWSLPGALMLGAGTELLAALSFVVPDFGGDDRMPGCQRN